MTNYRATIRHHSIARARVVNLGTNDLSVAKRRASAEFRGDFNDYIIVVLGDATPDNPGGIVASRRIGGKTWR